MKNPTFTPCPLARLLRETVFQALGMKQASFVQYDGFKDAPDQIQEYWTCGEAVVFLKVTKDGEVTITVDPVSHTKEGE